MQTTPEDQIIKKIRPFFLNYFNRLAGDLHTLTSVPVTCNITEVGVVRGRDELESAFEVDQSVAQIIEDGNNSGDIHIVMDVSTSIALSGMMMMMGESVIRDQVKSRNYTEEMQEGFQEVANQVVGALNDVVEKKMSGGHLILVLPTLYVPYGEFPSSLQDQTTYLQIVSEIQVGTFPVALTRWLLSKGFVEQLVNVKMAGTDAENAAEAASQQQSAGVDAAADSGSGTAGSSATAGGASAGVDGGAGSADGGVSGADTADRAAGAAAPVGDAAMSHLVSDDGDQSADVFAGSGASRGKDGKNTPLELPKIAYSTGDGLPSPDDPASVKTVMVEPPFTLPEDERVMKAINAMRYEGVRCIGVLSQGKLVRVVSQSDLRQIMGPFFGTKAMSARDKAICMLPIGKLNKNQQLVFLSLNATISQAAHLLTEYNLRMLPIISKQGVLRGFVTVHAVLDYYRRKKQKQ